MSVVIHTPRWFMLGNKDIQTSNGKDGLSYSINKFSAVQNHLAPQTETEPSFEEGSVEVSLSSRSMKVHAGELIISWQRLWQLLWLLCLLSWLQALLQL